MATMATAIAFTSIHAKSPLNQGGFEEALEVKVCRTGALQPPESVIVHNEPKKGGYPLAPATLDLNCGHDRCV